MPIRSRQSRGRARRVDAEHRDLARVRSRYPSRISTVVVLPAPFGPEKGEYLAASDLEVDPAHRFDVAVRLVKAGDRYRRAHRADCMDAVVPARGAEGVGEAAWSSPPGR